MTIQPFTEAYQVRKIMLGRCRLMNNVKRKWFYNVQAPSKITENYEVCIGIPAAAWEALEPDWNLAFDSWGLDRDSKIERVTEWDEQLAVVRTARKYQNKDGSEWAQPKIFDSRGQPVKPDLMPGHGSVIRPTILLRSTEKGGTHFMQVQPASFQLIKLEQHVGTYDAVEEEGAFVAENRYAPVSGGYVAESEVQAEF